MEALPTEVGVATDMQLQSISLEAQQWLAWVYGFTWHPPKWSPISLTTLFEDDDVTELI